MYIYYGNNFPPIIGKLSYILCSEHIHHFREIFTIVGIGVSTPPQKHPPPPLFLAKPPLNQQTVQAPPLPFLGNPPLYIGFSRPPQKSDLSVNPQNIKVLHP